MGSYVIARVHMIDVTIDKLVFGGQGMGHAHGRAVFSWNALPGERAAVWVDRRAKGVYEGIAAKILVPSAHRMRAREDHFLSCSPWQILSHEQENNWKTLIAKDVYEHIGKFDAPIAGISGADQWYEYRNKMEYSFAEDDDGVLSLAFFKRNRKKRMPMSECALAHPAITRAAHSIVRHLRERATPSGALKSLILRCNQYGEVIAGLFITDERFFSNKEDDIALAQGLKGCAVYWSDPKSPASVATRLLFSRGTLWLDETVCARVLRYGLFSFFQVNVPVFEQALFDMRVFVETSEPLVDYYAGVGSIGISLARQNQSVVLVDSNEAGITFARHNISANALSKAVAHAGMSENVLEHIAQQSTLIMDPPRQGVHKRMIERIVHIRPARIMYLSCNLSTHARDIGLLLGSYDIEFMRLYNFFPRTPHIEALCVLKKRQSYGS